MTQEQIRKQMEALHAVAAMHKTPEDSRQWLKELGLLKAPLKKKAKTKKK
jgi:hypothetical protein